MDEQTTQEKKRQTRKKGNLRHLEFGRHSCNAAVCFLMQVFSLAHLSYSRGEQSETELRFRKGSSEKVYMCSELTDQTEI